MVGVHTLRVSEKGIELDFLEHFKSGGSERTTYTMDSSARLLQIDVTKTSAESHPKPSSSLQLKVEGDELVGGGGGGGEPKERAKLPENAAAMPLMMFVLPALYEHLPESIKLTPVFGRRVLQPDFTLLRGAAQGEELPIELRTPKGERITSVVVSLAKATSGTILRIVAGDGETIRPLPAKEAKRQIAALRAKNTPGPASFATPRAAVEAFVAACAAGDLKAVGACFSAKAPGEFKSLRDGSVPPGDFKQLCDLFKGAVIGEAKTTGETAKVPVALTKRKESLTLVKESSGWKILDF